MHFAEKKIGGTKSGQGAQYHCVEFALDAAQQLYLFKLWHSVGNQMFLLVKENSAVLMNLKVGNVLPMKFLSDGSARRAEVCKTQIKQIINERQGRFQGHCRIEIEMLPQAAPMFQ